MDKKQVGDRYYVCPAAFMRTSEQCHHLVVLWEKEGSVDFDVDFS